MVRNERKSDEISEDDLVNIELGCFFERGLEIAFLLHEQVFRDSEKLGDELKHLFIREYLEKWIELSPKKEMITLTLMRMFCWK